MFPELAEIIVDDCWSYFRGFSAGGETPFGGCMGSAAGEVDGRFDVECVEEAREALTGIGHGEVTALAADHHILSA